MNNQNKTIAQQRNVTKFPYSIKDDNGNITYLEFSDGEWQKFEYDENGNRTYEEHSNGDWEKFEFDEHSNQTNFEDSNGVKK